MGQKMDPNYSSSRTALIISGPIPKVDPFLVQSYLPVSDVSHVFMGLNQKWVQKWILNIRPQERPLQLV